jgi:hypothetical protein
VKYTTFSGEKGKNFGYDVSQAMPVCPSGKNGKGRLRRS